MQAEPIDHTITPQSAVFDDDHADSTESTQRKPPTRAESAAAALLIMLSLALGMVGNGLFNGQPMGVNVLIFATLYMIVALWVLGFSKRPHNAKNLLLIAPALMFAALLSTVSAPQLVSLNTLLLFGLLVAALRFASVPDFLGGHPFIALMHMMDALIISWLREPLLALIESSGWWKSIHIAGENAHRLSSVLRGIILAAPIVVVFTLLLSSADSVFGDLAAGLVQTIQPGDLGDMLGNLLFIGIFAWFALNGLRLMLAPIALTPDDLIRDKRKKGRGLTMIESGIVLASVDLLFLVFMLIQARYLFGGAENITAQGYTYAEYARRGFEELIAVSCLTLGLTLWLDARTNRDRERDWLFKTLTITLIGLTMLLLFAAVYRLYLYENAYGYTRIRVASGVFALWLGVLLAVVVYDLLATQRRLFWVGVLLTTIGFALTLNLLNMDAFIARQNIARWERGESLDVVYLTTLSDDAVPLMADLIDHPDLSDSQRDTLLTELGYRLYALNHRSQSIVAHHFGRARAHDALLAHADALHDYTRARPSWYFNEPVRLR